MTTTPPQLDFAQVSTERRNTLELILVVLLLGLLLNCIVSAVFYFVDRWYVALVLLVISLLGSAAVLVLFVPTGLLEPARLLTEIPIVLFYDSSGKTLSLPNRIHYPQSKQSVAGTTPVGSTPFPIVARLYFDRSRRHGLLDESDLSDINGINHEVLVPLLQFMVLQHYIKAHLPTWGPAHGYTLGPFLHVGTVRSLPAREYDRGALFALSGNRFFQFLNENLPMSLPEGTDLELSSNTIRLDGRNFVCELAIHPRSTVSMQAWPLAFGTVSSWYRSLSSDYSDTHALLFMLRIEFTLKVGTWRFVAEDWLPDRFRPEIALRDITDWINGWVRSLDSFFDWVDDDLSFLPRAEVASLVDESELIYEPQLKGATRIHFKASPGGRPSAGTTQEDSEAPPTVGTGPRGETKMGQRQSIESHGGSVDLEHDFSAAVQWLRSTGRPELRTSKPTEFTAEAAVTQRGVHRGESVIIFRQLGREYGRAYACCWGHYYNCNRTRIGMYCTALDAAI